MPDLHHRLQARLSTPQQTLFSPFQTQTIPAATSHLAKLQAEAGGKPRITMRVDSDVLATFKARAEMIGGNYQTLMNDALKQFAHGLRLSDAVVAIK
jgi:uncharacterized protein (DUF4415 family)